MNKSLRMTPDTLKISHNLKVPPVIWLIRLPDSSSQVMIEVLMKDVINRKQFGKALGRTRRSSLPESPVTSASDSRAIVLTDGPN